MTHVTLTVNGETIAADLAPRTSLADLLRERLRLTGTHLGCEHGICGACTVLIDDAPARACIVLAVSCDGQAVRTIEGFDDDPVMAELRSAFSREHALQCGFCTPGMLIAGRDLALRLPDAAPETVRHELSGNLCRCTGYAGIVRAVTSVAAGEAAARARSAPPAAPPAFPAVAAPAVGASAAGATPVPSSAVSASTAVAPDLADAPAPPAGWTRFEETFSIARPPATVWAALCDFPMVASCVPGAELIEHGADHVRGRLVVAVGPIKAAFAGSAKIVRDETRRIGRVQGAGSDKASGSRSRAEATFRVEPESRDGSRVVLVVDYVLQGTLAQVSRSGVAQEIGRRLVATFAANLDAALAGDTAPARTPAALDAKALLWASLKAWLGRLLGRSRG